AVGLLANDVLPDTAPQGAGGGYVIVKNSWGCFAGDGGYYYLPFDWVKAFVRSARAAADVEVVGQLPDQPVDPLLFPGVKPIPPSVHIVQPSPGDRFSAGQTVSLVLGGTDYQYDGYKLGGSVVWWSSLQGRLAEGVTTSAILNEGTHVITVVYVSKDGTSAV